MRTICSRRNRDIMERSGRLLIGYLTAGYPRKDSFPGMLRDCEAAGMDIFEVGYPAADPSADGEVIRRAHNSVDKSITRDLGYWREIRAAVGTPVWVMGYAADLVASGYYRTLAQEGVVDAFVIPDLDTDAALRLGDELAEWDVDMVCFARPQMEDTELNTCFANSALVYHQLYAGPTGSGGTCDEYGETLRMAKKYNHVHIFAGFGIDTAERVRAMLQSGYDGAIVGTAMLRHLNESEQVLLDFIREIKAEIGR